MFKSRFSISSGKTALRSCDSDINCRRKSGLFSPSQRATMVSRLRPGSTMSNLMWPDCWTSAAKFHSILGQLRTVVRRTCVYKTRNPALLFLSSLAHTHRPTRCQVKHSATAALTPSCLTQQHHRRWHLSSAIKVFAQLGRWPNEVGNGEDHITGRRRFLL